jgi:hypothetical protein
MTRAGLGIEPDSPPRGVYRRIVPSATGVALIEREQELGAMREGLDRAHAGEGAVLLVEGPAGVGKTELVREARATAARGGATALEAKGSELEQPFAFGVVRQLLEPVIGQSSEQGDLFAGAAGPQRAFSSLTSGGRPVPPRTSRHCTASTG